MLQTFLHESTNSVHLLHIIRFAYRGRAEEVTGSRPISMERDFDAVALVTNARGMDSAHYDKR